MLILGAGTNGWRIRPIACILSGRLAPLGLAPGDALVRAPASISLQIIDKPLLAAEILLLSLFKQTGFKIVSQGIGNDMELIDGPWLEDTLNRSERNGSFFYHMVLV